MTILALSVNAQVINLNEGWNNVGIIADTPITDFNNDNIDYIWQYNNGWYFYSPNESVMNAVRNDISNGLVNYDVINSTVSEGSALWIHSNANTQIRVGEVSAYTSVFGVVKDSTNHNVINNFEIIIDGDVNETHEFNNTDGTFDLNSIRLGEHTFTFRADGYQELNMSIDLESYNPENLGQIYLVPNSDVVDINLSGRIVDATTGNNINGVRIQMIPGYNNTNGTPVYDYYSTDGTYNAQIQAGPYTVVITANGYYSTTYNYTFSSENGDNISQDFALAPRSDTSDTNNTVLRAVLTWGEMPSDLDSHLVALDTETNTTLWHVYFDHRNAYVNENNETVRVANLDVDDTSSYGPETITLSEMNTSAVYKYYVYNYSNESDLKDSNAHLVVIYNGREYNFQVPNEEGRIWKVFEINNGVLIPCVENCMINSNSYEGDYQFYYNLRTTNSSDAQAINDIINSYLNNPK